MLMLASRWTKEVWKKGYFDINHNFILDIKNNMFWICWATTIYGTIKNYGCISLTDMNSFSNFRLNYKIKKHKELITKYNNDIEL